MSIVGKKWTFSKIIIIFLGIMTVAVTGVSIWLMITTYDTSPLIYLLPVIGTETTAATIGYYYKEKAENKIKITKTCLSELIDKYGDTLTDTQVNLISNILSD